MSRARGTLEALPPNHHKVDEPLDPSPGDVTCSDIPNDARLSLGIRNVGGSGPRKPGKIPWGKAGFPPGILPRLSPDALHPGWRLSAAGPEICKFRYLPATGGSCLFSLTANNRLVESRGRRPLVGGLGAESPQRALSTVNRRFSFPWRRARRRSGGRRY